MTKKILKGVITSAKNNKTIVYEAMEHNTLGFKVFVALNSNVLFYKVRVRNDLGSRWQQVGPAN